MDSPLVTHILIFLIGCVCLIAIFGDNVDSDTGTTTTSTTITTTSTTATTESTVSTTNPERFPCMDDSDCPNKTVSYSCSGVFVVQNGTGYECEDGECVETNISVHFAECSPGFVCVSGRQSCVRKKDLPAQNDSGSCDTSADCMAPVTGAPYCSGNVLMQTTTSGVCNEAGTSTPYCANMTTSAVLQACKAGERCLAGACQKTNATTTTIIATSTTSTLATPQPTTTSSTIQLTSTTQAAPHPEGLPASTTQPMIFSTSTLPSAPTSTPANGGGKESLFDDLAYFFGSLARMAGL